MSDFNFIPESDDRILEYLGPIRMVPVCFKRRRNSWRRRKGTVVSYWQLYLCMRKWAINALLLDACWIQWFDGKRYTHLAQSIPVCINKQSLSFSIAHTHTHRVSILFCDGIFSLSYHTQVAYTHFCPLSLSLTIKGSVHSKYTQIENIVSNPLWCTTRSRTQRIFQSVPRPFCVQFFIVTGIKDKTFFSALRNKNIIQVKYC